MLCCRTQTAPLCVSTLLCFDVAFDTYARHTALGCETRYSPNKCESPDGMQFQITLLHLHGSAYDDTYILIRVPALLRPMLSRNAGTHIRAQLDSITSFALLIQSAYGPTFNGFTFLAYLTANSSILEVCIAERETHTIRSPHFFFLSR